MTISQWLNRLLFVLLEKQTDLSKLDKFNFSKQEEIKVVRNHLKEAFLVFKKNAIEDGNPVMCKIHDSFRTREMVDHNCLGCNFADSTWLIHNFLRTYRHQREIKHAYSTLIILAYFLVERIDEFFKIIKLEEPYRRENFKILVEIRRWANFLKHPKAFLLTHHPVFSFENSSKNEELVKNAN
ncbi:MAG: hypothetical protein NT009_12610, partial [Proteobacteria bacterium]|nr:hypothetical protein [Pseudomonadota bacterium]